MVDLSYLSHCYFTTKKQYFFIIANLRTEGYKHSIIMFLKMKFENWDLNPILISIFIWCKTDSRTQLHIIYSHIL